MQDARTLADGTTLAFRKQIRMAAWRYRLERLARTSSRLAWAVAAALLVLLLVALILVSGTWLFPLALTVVFAGVAVGLGILEARVDRHRLLVRMDAHAKLPDVILSAGDWESAPRDPWRERQRTEALQLLSKLDWKQIWPIHWPRLLWLPLVTTFLLMAVLWKVQMDWVKKQWQAQVAMQQENAPANAEQLKPLEQVFQDWDEAQKVAPSPELAELLKQIKPMRDQMASGQMTEKQVLLKMNDIQARLQAAKDKLEASSLEPMAQSLADAVKDLDGMSGLAAALQRKDFAAAKEQAAQAQQKYESGAAKMPEGANAQTASDRLGEAAQKASSDPQASSSLSQMQNAVSNKDSSSMSKGLSGLKDSLAQQSQKQSQCHNLSLQLAQMGQCKNGMCNGSGIKMGMPQLSLAKSMQPSKGAGSTVDPNRYGAATQLDANHQEMKITGTAGQGASETQTESTKDPHFEQTASNVNSAQFAAYEKLSEEATQDENLPVADRQMIKRYFEDIRPQGNQ